MPWYNWKIVEIGTKHHISKPWPSQKWQDCVFFNHKYFLIGSNTSPVTQQHARCMCGHTPLHRKTLHQTPNIPRHTAILNMTTTNGGRRQNYQGNKHSNKTLWLMLAGTGLFTYSVSNKNMYVSITVISLSITHDWSHFDYFTFFTCGSFFWKSQFQYFIADTT